MPSPARRDTPARGSRSPAGAWTSNATARGAALRWLAVVAVAIAGAVLFPVAGVLPWAWRRECGPLGVVHAVAFFGPGLVAIVVLAREILNGRLRLRRGMRVVLGTIAVEWVLGVLFFLTQLAC